MKRGWLTKFCETEETEIRQNRCLECSSDYCNHTSDYKIQIPTIQAGMVKLFIASVYSKRPCLHEKPATDTRPD